MTDDRPTGIRSPASERRAPGDGVDLSDGFIRGPARFAKPGGWMTGVLLVAQTGIFVAALGGAFGSFPAQDALSALRWGLPAAVLLMVSLTIGTLLRRSVETNRLLVAVARMKTSVAVVGPPDAGPCARRERDVGSAGSAGVPIGQVRVKGAES